MKKRVGPIIKHHSHAILCIILSKVQENVTCVCERCACQNLSHIYCTRPPQSQNSCHLLSNSGFWRQYRYIRVIVFSFVSKCLSPVCHNQVLGLETILLHKIDDPSQLRKTRSKTKSHILSIYRYLKVSDNDYCSCELSRVATAG